MAKPDALQMSSAGAAVHLSKGTAFKPLGLTDLQMRCWPAKNSTICTPWESNASNPECWIKRNTILIKGFGTPARRNWSIVAAWPSAATAHG